MSQSVLAAELENLVPTTDSIAAVQTIADAYGGYVEDATSNGVAILSTASPVVAMAAAIAFPLPGTPLSAGNAIAAGVAAFWATIASTPATYFTGATIVTPPPGLSSLGDSLAAIFPSNFGSSLIDSASNIAGVIATASAGAVATFPGPSPFPIV